MAEVIQYSSTLPNPVTGYFKSVNTPDYLGQPNTLINPVIDGSVAGQPIKYWKVVNSVVVLMTQGERDAVDAALAAANLASQRARAKGIFDSTASDGKVLKAIVLLLIDELNDLRGWLVDFKAEVAAASNLADLKTRVAGLPNMTDRTSAQARTAIRGKIDNGSAD